MRNHFFHLVTLCLLLGVQACTPEVLEDFFPPISPEDESPLNIELSPCEEGVETAIDSINMDVIDYINENFSDVTIVAAETFEQEGEEITAVELSNGVSILFDADGLVISSANEDDEELLEVDSLLQQILDFVAENYPDTNIDEAEIVSEWGQLYLEIHLEDDTELIFDLEGNFWCSDEEEEEDDDHDDDDEEEDDDDGDDDDDEEEDDDDGDDDDDDDDDDEEEDDDDDEEEHFPESIVDFIATQYPGYHIDDVDREELCDSTEVYEVEIEMGESELELYFDLEGNFLFTLQEGSEGDLPEAVVAALQANYPDYTLESDDIEILEMADGTLQYQLEIETDTTDLEIWLDASGNILLEC